MDAAGTPVKEIEQGVSADHMVNHTVIRSSTGRGGYAMRFTDTITPNGVAYSVSNMKVIDESDNNKDISAQFTIAWDQQANTVTAVRKDQSSMMPLEHTYAFHLDVTVSAPDFSKVTDQANVLWNDTDQSTESKGVPHAAAEPGQELDQAERGWFVGGGDRPGGDQQHGCRPEPVP